MAIFRNFCYYLEKVWYLATQVNPLFQRSLDSKEGWLVWVNDCNLHSHYHRCSVVAIFFVTTKMISYKSANWKSEGVHFECPYSIRNVLLIMKGKKKGRINVNLFENQERLKAQVMWWVGQWCLIKEEVIFFAIYKRPGPSSTCLPMLNEFLDERKYMSWRSWCDGWKAYNQASPYFFLCDPGQLKASETHFCPTKQYFFYLLNLTAYLLYSPHRYSLYLTMIQGEI